MENKRKIASWLFKPFQYIAGRRSLIIGIITLFVLALAGFLTNTYFDGVLDAHYGSDSESSSFGTHLVLVFGSWLAVSTIMYLTALLFNRKTRIVDMFGTMAMAKAPYLIIALSGLISTMHPDIDLRTLIQIDHAEMQAMLMTTFAPMLLASIVLIPIIVWSVALMYNAFSVSSNLKGTKGGISFTVALITSEIITIIVFSLPALIKLIST